MGDTVRPRVDDCGVIRLPARAPFADRLARLQREFEAVVRRVAPATAAVESLFHGRGTRAALQLAHARGVILAVLATAGVEVEEYSPATVKQAVTGSGRADKDQVRQMVERLLDPPTRNESSDLSDALAVAWCHATTRGFRAAVDRSLGREDRRPT